MVTAASRIIFSREHFADVWEEIIPLAQAHYNEIAWRQEQIPLSVDYERYCTLDETGALLCFFARTSNKLIGYSMYFVDYHPHYSTTKMAVNDVVFLDPAFRNQGTGIDFISYCEGELKALGVNVVTLHVKPKLDFGPLCQKMGYEVGDRIWLKWLGNDEDEDKGA